MRLSETTFWRMGIAPHSAWHHPPGSAVHVQQVNNSYFQLASYHICGWNLQSKQADLAVKLQQRRPDVLCLQKSKLSGHSLNDCRSASYKWSHDASKQNAYSLWIFISPLYVPSVHYSRSVSGRIAYLVLHVRDQNVVIINVCVPHMGWPHRADETSHFYSNLTQVAHQFAGKAQLFEVADFSVKLSKKAAAKETFPGKFCRGIRNSNGLTLAVFSESTKLNVASTFLAHKACHLASW